jgi:formate dehydrogenase major subunit
VNPHRVTQVLYRAPYSDHWETKSIDWAMDRIARKVKAARDADFTVRNPDGRLLNSVRSFGTLGGATIDNEENYLIKKLFGGGLGVISIENQARI